MSDLAELCTEWILDAVICTNLFVSGDEQKVFEVYDPAVLQEIAARLNYPVCGVIYEGIASENRGVDAGITAYLSVGIVVMAASRARDARQAVDKGTVTVVLDTMRDQIKKRTSPTQNPWEFVIEVPMDLGDRGLVYYQKWRTRVVI